MAPRPSPVYLLVAAVTWPVLMGLFRLRARGREHLPAGGFVLAANHNSNFDPWPLGIPLFPKRFLRFMAKSELFWTPFKQFATAAGAFPVRRGQADAEAMATAILRMLSDDAMAVRMGHAARQRIAERFSVKQMVRATEDIYLELLDRKPRKRLPSAAC